MTKPPPFRPGFNPSVRIRIADAPSPQDVAAWIAKHGVTRCPTVAVDRTTAIISEADREAAAAHAAAMEERNLYGAYRRALRNGTKAAGRIAGRQASSLAQRSRV